MPKTLAGMFSTNMAKKPAIAPSIAPHSGNRCCNQPCGAIMAQSPQTNGTKHHAASGRENRCTPAPGSNRTASAAIATTTDATRLPAANRLRMSDSFRQRFKGGIAAAELLRRSKYKSRCRYQEREPNHIDSGDSSEERRIRSALHITPSSMVPVFAESGNISVMPRAIPRSTGHPHAPHAGAQ